MSLIKGDRASSILFNFLSSHRKADPWILPANCCEVLVAVFQKVGQPFELADIDRSYAISLDLIEEKLKKKKLSGFVYIRPYGFIDDEVTNRLLEIKSKAPDVNIVDDRCLSIPSVESERINLDLILWSTGYGKVVDLGGGGFALSSEWNPTGPYSANSPKDGASIEGSFAKASQIWKKSWPEDPIFFTASQEAWLSPNCDLAEPGAVLIADLNDRLARRDKINSIYKNSLPNEIQMPNSHQGWRFNVLIEDQKLRDKIFDTIFREGLFASRHYRVQSRNESRFPQAQKLHSKIINLFNDQNFTFDQAEKVSAIINKLVS